MEKDTGTIPARFMDRIAKEAESSAEAVAGIAVEESDLKGKELDELAKQVAARVANIVADTLAEQVRNTQK